MASKLFKFGLSKNLNKTIPPPGGPLPGRESEMTEGDFTELRDEIYKQSGIFYTESKKYLLEGRVVKRLEELKVETFSEYTKMIKSGMHRNELEELFKVITINETYFFRALPQFDAFENIIAPELLEQKSISLTPYFRIWSAASSTGEEAYTLAIIILEKLKPKYPKVQFQILASDINTDVLNSARKGVYREYAIRNVPPHILDKYFTKNGNTWILSDTVKNMVKFTKLNLYDSNMVKSVLNCDVIFCANVLIYFDLPSKQKVVSNLYNSLNKGGYLFIGYSESLHGVSKAFKLVHMHKAMAYKKE